MREHMGLYRGKRIDNGEWEYGNLIISPHYGEKCVMIERRPEYMNRRDYAVPMVDPDTVGECTGLRDKNGQLIFEGDVTKDEWYREWEIVGCPGGFAALRRAEEWRLMGPAAGLSDAQNASWLEGTHVIIGNIHDNPELKGGEQ